MDASRFVKDSSEYEYVTVEEYNRRGCPAGYSIERQGGYPCYTIPPGVYIEGRRLESSGHVGATTLKSNGDPERENIVVVVLKLKSSQKNRFKIIPKSALIPGQLRYYVSTLDTAKSLLKDFNSGKCGPASMHTVGPENYTNFHYAIVENKEATVAVTIKYKNVQAHEVREGQRRWWVGTPISDSGLTTVVDTDLSLRSNEYGKKWAVVEDRSVTTSTPAVKFEFIASTALKAGQKRLYFHDRAEGDKYIADHKNLTETDFHDITLNHTHYPVALTVVTKEAIPAFDVNGRYHIVYAENVGTVPRLYFTGVKAVSKWLELFGDKDADEKLHMRSLASGIDPSSLLPYGYYLEGKFVFAIVKNTNYRLPVTVVPGSRAGYTDIKNLNQNEVNVLCAMLDAVGTSAATRLKNKLTSTNSVNYTENTRDGRDLF